MNHKQIAESFSFYFIIVGVQTTESPTTEQPEITTLQPGMFHFFQIEIGYRTILFNVINFS